MVIPERLGGRVIEGFLVADNVGMPDGGQNPHFINCVVNLSIREVDQFDFLQGIDGVVDSSLDLVDAGIRSFSQLVYDLEVVYGHLLFDNYIASSDEKEHKAD